MNISLLHCVWTDPRFYIPPVPQSWLPTTPDIDRDGNALRIVRRLGPAMQERGCVGTGEVETEPLEESCTSIEQPTETSRFETDTRWSCEKLRTVKFDSMYEYMIKYANLSAVQRTQSATEELNSGLDQGLLFGYKALSSTLNPASLSAYLLPKRVVSLIPPFSGTDGRCLNWYATCLNMLRCKQCLLLATV
jgi:hypothetical protein